MDSPFGLYDDDEATAEENARAMADALRGQNKFGTLWQLSGDPLLGRAGSGLLGQAGKSQEFLADAGKARLENASRGRLAKATAAKGANDIAEGLRKEVMGNQVTKATQELAAAHAKLQPSFARPSAAGDLGIVYGIMKMYDPSSGVKEGETATAQNAAGVPDRIRAVWNRLLTGEGLSTTARADFAQQADDLYSAQLDRYDPVAKGYGDLAGRQGVRPEDVIFDLGFKRPEKRAPKGRAVETRVSRDGSILEKLPDGTIRKRAP